MINICFALAYLDGPYNVSKNCGSGLFKAAGSFGPTQATR